MILKPANQCLCVRERRAAKKRDQSYGHLSERTLVENGISRYRNMACAYATHKQTTARAFASAIESRLCVCVSSELLEKARKRDGNEKGGEERY